jgi:virginiamycin B lyase
LAIGAGHIFWTNYDDSTIGRAGVDGTHVRQAFITGAIGPAGLAITAQH